MPSDQRDSRRKNLMAEMSRALRARGLKMSQCGRDADDSSVRAKLSLTTGTWSASGERTKPQRWILHLSGQPGSLQVATSGDEYARRLGYFNTSREELHCACVRVLPLFATSATSFLPCDDWEWVLWFLFDPPLSTGGSSESLNYNPFSGEVSFLNGVRPYSASGLIAVCDPTANLSGVAGLATTVGALTYSEATSAVANFIQVSASSLPPQIAAVPAVSP